jgi:2-oxo-4-hydroxy-4-carboxy-5-ureidoimidazoline decarboxylase
MSQRLTLSALNDSAVADLVAALPNVVEHSPWIAAALASKRPFHSVAGLRGAIIAAIDGASPEQCLTLIRSHPDLGDRLQRAAGLTAESELEQGGAGLDRLSDAEYAVFDELNRAYREKFGFPFILCVRRHTKDSIIETFRRRLQNPPDAEMAEAICEIGRIATLRLAQLVEDDGTLRVNGRLSTHVLDTHAGCPAVGLMLTLAELSQHGPARIVARAITNADGRTDEALIAEQPVPIGTYELRFEVADYYRRRGVTLAEPPFLDTVAVRFGVAEPEGHLHVPLLMTPGAIRPIAAADAPSLHRISFSLVPR